MRVLVDADAYIGAYSVNDPHHKVAEEIFDKYAHESTEWFTTVGVVNEVATKLSYYFSKALAKKFLDTLLRSETEIIFPDEVTFRESVGIFTNIKTKNVSLTDCTNVSVYNTYSIDRIFSFDKIYAKQGLRILS